VQFLDGSWVPCPPCYTLCQQPLAGIVAATRQPHHRRDQKGSQPTSQLLIPVQVGPNGCGKSAIGEAVAFALGGNKRMLRAKSYDALINSELRARGVYEAQVGYYVVVLSMILSSSDCILCTPCSQVTITLAYPGRYASGVASPSTVRENVRQGHHQGQIIEKIPNSSLCTTDMDLKSLQHGVLRIRRSLRGCPAATSLHTSRGDAAWQRCSQVQLQQQLQVLGLHTEAVDRCAHI